MGPISIVLAALLAVAIVALAVAFAKLRPLQRDVQAAAQERDEATAKVQDLDASVQQREQEFGTLRARFQVIVDADAEAARIREQAQSEWDERRRQLESAKNTLKASLMEERVRSLGALAQERDQLTNDVQRLQGETLRAREEQGKTLSALALESQRLNGELARVRLEVRAYDDAAEVASFGFYKPRYDFDSSSKYQARIDAIRAQQKEMLKAKLAATCSQSWIIEGDANKGRKMIDRILKLALRAFNGQCDAAIAKVKYNNVQVMETRIGKAWEAINKLVEEWHASIASDYRHLKMQELYLVHEYQEKVQEEKEEQRRIREQMREEEAAAREIEKAQVEAEREEQRWEDALAKARGEAERAVGVRQEKLQWQVEELQRRLEEARVNKERAISRAQMTRAGHVYVISNIGSFGEGIYKIGMTRRLEPLDRVRELGDASVPFLFDVHAVIFSEDAPALEAKLHKLFHHRRVNAVNERREFFRVSLQEIADAVRANHSEMEFIHDAEAKEYRQTLAVRSSSSGAAAEASQVQSNGMVAVI